ncbi:glycosyl transferase, group 1 [Magnetococcus marinus MC-1]|uniref:Glycosyl transferase, group 1 n=1 Tax=Magnetococcus marinus (strain ATCC BAA-1437 / JCM 17883 / MC-1) TaxID=156889 RepID=A0L405_MAGMM|nr:glycosyltransferase [Magnetococcus marinus]ABK42698.1 glycosyl transferase, group 1 [Magnetococcus marinus MC-1]
MPPTKHPLSVAYVNSIDLPDNRRAHAMQMLKNGQAWSQCVEQFEFITNVWWHNRNRLTVENMAAFYGLTHPFTLIPYPLRRLEQSQYRWLRELYFQLAAWRCKRKRVDLVYTRTYPLLAYTLKLGIPTVVETHSPPGRNEEADAMLSLADHPNLVALTTISEPLAERYRAFGVPADKIMVLPDGVDLERFEPALTLAEARQQLGLPLNQSIATYVGHLYEGRGIDTLLSAALKQPKVLFLIVGGYAKDMERWQHRAAQMGLENVRFEGFVANERVPLYLWAGDVLVMPYGNACTTTEWMSPLKLFEYMAAGRPIIASDFPILREVLENGKNGLLVPPDDGEALAAAMDALLADAPRRQALGAAALHQVRPYSWVNRVEQVINRFNRYGQ